MNQTGLLRPINVVPNYQWVPLPTIKLDSGTQCRYEIDSQAVNRYAKLMKDSLWNWNCAQDPIVLFVSGEGIFPGDGHHRIVAAQQALIPLVYAEVRSGTLLDAQLYALQANTNHGLPLRPKDTRNRVAGVAGYSCRSNRRKLES
jgi:hypothetical protein